LGPVGGCCSGKPSRLVKEDREWRKKLSDGAPLDDQSLIAAWRIFAGGISGPPAGTSKHARFGGCWVATLLRPAISGTDSRQIKPSERQSNWACPPSCDSMLAITLLVPKAARCRLLHKGAVPLLPQHLKDLALDLPFDRKAARQRRQSPIFCRISDEFVQRHGQRLRSRPVAAECLTR